MRGFLLGRIRAAGPVTSHVRPHGTHMRTAAVQDARIEIVPYDPSWPTRFQAERALLAEVLSPWLVAPIEHVGSTSVPGLPAKPIIDILVPVESLETSRASIELLRQIGYVYYPYKPEQMHWFCKPSPEVRTHHLHMVAYRSPVWVERLAFRDALRTNPDLTSQYAELKLRLAVEHRVDRERYTEAKSPFIQAALGRSQGEGESAA